MKLTETAVYYEGRPLMFINEILVYWVTDISYSN